MSSKYAHIESVYWVFTQVCNDNCDHCYNESGPFGRHITEEECMKIIDNLPEKMDRLILSGGEPLAERKKLYHILDRLQERYGHSVEIMLQTNGDLLNEKKLDALIEKGITRFDIASIDRYHKHAGERLEQLAQLFASRGVNGDESEPLIDKENYVQKGRVTWGHWGATEDMWLGGNWARGRAMQKNLWKRDPGHNFCGVLSGGIGFLTGQEDIPQEISIQLWKINPCCPGTRKPMGDARKEKVSDVLERVSESKIFQEINKGDPWKMGESIGVSEEYARQRTEELENVCLWCDEFFTRHFDMRKMIPREEENTGA